MHFVFFAGKLQPTNMAADLERKNSSSSNFQLLNFTNGKLIWEGGSFPYDETKDEENDNAFYNRAVIVAPIVGSIFIVFLVVVGVYSLRQYDIPDLTRDKDVESLCENCSQTRRTAGIRYKIQHYVMRIFDVKQDAYLVRIDPKYRTVNCKDLGEARETLV